MARAGKGKPCGDSFISASKKCNIGQLSQRLNKGMLAKATTEKLKDYLNRAPYKYQRDVIKAELDRRAGKAPSVPSDLKKQLAALAGPTNRGLQREKMDSLPPQRDSEPPGLAILRRMREKGENEPSAKPAVKDGDLSRQINAGFLKNAAKEKLEEYLQRAPYKYQRDKIQAALNERAKMDGAKPEGGNLSKGGKWGKWTDEKLQDQLDEAKRRAKLDQIDEIEKELKRRGVEPRAMEPAGRPKGMNSWELQSAVSIDDRIERDTTKALGDSTFVWGNSLVREAKVLGSGAYGTAIKDKGGDVVKRGTIGDNEADLIDKIGKADLGPRLIAAQLDGPAGPPNTSTGRVAMTLVPGTPIGRRAGDAPIGKTGKVVSDAYWEARAKLHRMGIAHNDMHIENVFVDRKGNGRFVDMGMAQDNPKAALAEAMGAFTRGPMGTSIGSDTGDWQVRRWDGTAGRDMTNAERSNSPVVRQEFARRFPTAAKVLQNKEKAISKMKSFGLSDQDVADIIGHGIRKDNDSFEKGAMGRLTNDQALKIINILYDGI
jgi:hypothetical protein